MRFECATEHLNFFTNRFQPLDDFSNRCFHLPKKCWNKFLFADSEHAFDKSHNTGVNTNDIFLFDW